jgi:hypothetical protein
MRGDDTILISCEDHGVTLTTAFALSPSVMVTLFPLFIVLVRLLDRTKGTGLNGYYSEGDNNRAGHDWPWYVRNMVSSSVRYCDCCEDVIPKGKQYAACMVPMRSVSTVRKSISAGKLDLLGNLHFDFCRDCRFHMVLRKEALVN